MDGDVLTAKDFAIGDGKTKSFIQAAGALVATDRLLIVGKGFDEMTKRAGRNHQHALLMTADEVNTEHLLYFDKIVVLDDALETLAARTGGE